MKSQTVEVHKKQYVAPKLVERGNIETITQANKQFGIGDGFFLIIDGASNPIANHS